MLFFNTFLPHFYRKDRVKPTPKLRGGGGSIDSMPLVGQKIFSENFYFFKK
jgi:hypothetical protein